jgi:hypothetical protein
LYAEVADEAAEDAEAVADTAEAVALMAELEAEEDAKRQAMDRTGAV